MKLSTLIFVILLSSKSLIAQNKNSENAVHYFLMQFNNRKFDDIYYSFSPAYQQKISKKDLHAYLHQIYGMAGKFKSGKFKALKDGTYNYFLITNDGDVNADFLFNIDQNNKIDYLNFKRIGGSGNPPAISKMN